MDDINKLCIRRIQSYEFWHVLEIWLCRIKTRDTTQPVYFLSNVPADVGSQTMPNYMYLLWLDLKLRLKEGRVESFEFLFSVLIPIQN